MSSSRFGREGWVGQDMGELELAAFGQTRRGRTVRVTLAGHVWLDGRIFGMVGDERYGSVAATLYMRVMYCSMEGRSCEIGTGSPCMKFSHHPLCRLDTGQILLLARRLQYSILSCAAPRPGVRCRCKDEACSFHTWIEIRARSYLLTIGPNSQEYQRGMFHDMTGGPLR